MNTGQTRIRKRMNNGSNAELISNMEDRKAYLDALLQQAVKQNEKLQTLPSHRIRIQKHGSGFQYYLRSDKKDTSGKYLKRDQDKLVQKIMQKEYLQKLIPEIEKELSILNQYLNKFGNNQLGSLYENLHIARKNMVEPLEITDEKYVEQWLSVPYKGKEFKSDFPEYYTQKTERVRSKSEIIIANTLQKYGVPYRYEYPILVNGMGTVYPDFTVLNVRKRKEIYFEHLGLIDDKEYRENAMRKIVIYEENNIYLGDNLIVTYESEKHPLDVKALERKITKYLV